MAVEPAETGRSGLCGLHSAVTTARPRRVRGQARPRRTARTRLDAAPRARRGPLELPERFAARGRGLPRWLAPAIRFSPSGTTRDRAFPDSSCGHARPTRRAATCPTLPVRQHGAGCESSRSRVESRGRPGTAFTNFVYSRRKREARAALPHPAAVRIPLGRRPRRPGTRLTRSSHTRSKWSPMPSDSELRRYERVRTDLA